MMDIVIIGAGGFGREIAWLIEDINKNKKEWNVVGFVDDDLSKQGECFNGYQVVGDIEWLKDKELFAVCAIGDPRVKRETISRLHGTKIKLPVLVHPSVIISDSVSIGEGSLICAGCILTVNILIGKCVTINIDSTVGHDAVIGDYSTILPSVNVSGSVRIEPCVSIGTGAAVINDVKIGENSVIGAGAVVVRDLPSDCTAVGVPAKPLK